MRALCPNIWILAPGVGAQGGDLDDVIRAAIRDDGMGIVVPISRGISRAEDPHAAAVNYRDQINSAIERVLTERKAAAKMVLDSTQKQFIEAAIRASVLRFGEFKLKSGRLSPYFFNMGNFKTGRDMAEVAECYTKTILKSGLEFDVIFGPAYKGIPLCAVVAAAMAQHGRNVEFAYNRKEAKDHGEGGSLVGYKPQDGDRIIIIEDVITAGTAIRETLPLLLESAKVTVPDMFISVNRCEVGQNPGKTAVMEVREQFGIDVHAIVTVQDIYEYLKGRADYAELLPRMEDYMSRYCVFD